MFGGTGSRRATPSIWDLEEVPNQFPNRFIRAIEDLSLMEPQGQELPYSEAYDLQRMDLRVRAGLLAPLWIHAVQHTTRARDTGAGSARVVHGAHDTSSDLASHSRRES